MRLLRALVFAGIASLFVGCAGTQHALPEGKVAHRFKRLDGSTLSLGDYRGRVVLVTVMNTWAGPALIEVPRFSRMVELYGPEFAVVAVALDDTETAVEVFSRTFEVPYEVVLPYDKKALTGDKGPFGPVMTIPTSVLIDRAGAIAFRADGTCDPERLKEAVEGLLAADPRKD